MGKLIKACISLLLTLYYYETRLGDDLLFCSQNNKQVSKTLHAKIDPAVRHLTSDVSRIYQEAQLPADDVPSDLMYNISPGLINVTAIDNNHVEQFPLFEGVGTGIFENVRQFTTREEYIAGLFLMASHYACSNNAGNLKFDRDVTFAGRAKELQEKLFLEEGVDLDYVLDYVFYDLYCGLLLVIGELFFFALDPPSGGGNPLQTRSFYLYRLKSRVEHVWNELHILKKEKMRLKLSRVSVEAIAQISKAKTFDITKLEIDFRKSRE